MNLSVTFRRAARAEFIEAASWYESQRPGLGVERDPVIWQDQT
jgi:hypothetical protein